MSTKAKGFAKEKEGKVGAGSRYNVGKANLILFSTLAKKGTTAVLDWAAKGKYSAWNFSKGLDIAEVINSLERHLDDLKEGKFYDKDSSLPIVDHVGCNVMFLQHFWHMGQWTELDANMPYQHVLFPEEVGVE